MIPKVPSPPLRSLAVQSPTPSRHPLEQIVVVLSGSMEPGFYRGDILFLDQPKGPIETGNIIVFNAGDREIPIVHRIIKVHERHNNISAVDILTKVWLGTVNLRCSAMLVSRELEA